MEGRSYDSSRFMESRSNDSSRLNNRNSKRRLEKEKWNKLQ